MVMVGLLRTIIYVYIILCLFVSCSNNKNKYSGYVNPINEIQNFKGCERLRDSIKEYINNVEYVNRKGKRIVAVDCQMLEDTTYFEISYMINLSTLMYVSPIYLGRIGDFDVIFQSNISRFIPEDKEQNSKYYEKFFPEKYKECIEDGSIPVPDIWDHESWKLVFVRDSCVRKERIGVVKL